MRTVRTSSLIVLPLASKSAWDLVGTLGKGDPHEGWNKIKISL